MSGFSQDITVCGSAGYLTFTNNTLKGRKNGASKDQTFHQDTHETQTEDSGLPVVHSVGLVRMLSDMKDVFLSRSRDHGAATFSDGLYVQAVMEAIRKSSDTRQWRKVEMFDEDGSGPVQI